MSIAALFLIAYGLLLTAGVLARLYLTYASIRLARWYNKFLKSVGQTPKSPFLTRKQAVSTGLTVLMVIAYWVSLIQVLS